MHQIVVAAMVYDSDNKRLPSMLEWLYPTNGVFAPGIVDPSTDLTKGQLYPYLQSKSVYCCPSETGSAPSGGPIDHGYQISCESCHAHDSASCLAPARTVYFTEVTNLSRGFRTGMTQPPTNPNFVTPNFAFRHTRREHFVFMDGHFERLTRVQFANISLSDPRFWYPTTDMSLNGVP